MLLGQRQTNVQQGVSSVRGFIEVWSSGGSKSTFPVGTLVPWLFLAAALVPSTGICRTVQAEALDCRPCVWKGYFVQCNSWHRCIEFHFDSSLLSQGCALGTSGLVPSFRCLDFQFWCYF